MDYFICIFKTIRNFIHFKGYRQHSCFRQLYKTNYFIEWIAISHGCLWQMYQLRKQILPIVLPSMVEAETLSDYPRILWKSVKKMKVSLIYDKNNEYITWQQIWVFDHISLCSQYKRKFLNTFIEKFKNVLKVQ